MIKPFARRTLSPKIIEITLLDALRLPVRAAAERVSGAAAPPRPSPPPPSPFAQVPVAEVEPWVVRAISRGLVDARMDQTAATVTVTRTIQRDFGSSQWTGLQSKLRAWRDNVGALLASME